MVASEQWLQQLNATCNRLSTQYLSLLRAASSVSALEEGRHDPRAGGTLMKTASDPPPPPLAADVALSSLQCLTATDNILVACNQILTLIRTLRLSLLLMDHDTMHAEECLQVELSRQRADQTLREIARLEPQLLELVQQEENETTTTTTNDN
eukprot:CAMPEP_0168784312 /NCGR_PEP_ID=MMETSP0725-20121227/10155_1 /TAXON_ID=265536 /ORGANISM="Amphiprora sp., Strain CCMP467" /LENGTH=152 /DNA_ID=CAMNT_0008834353 /DNA_START=183 /DNA_END=641 /DNA_ORIENTATION=+